MDVKLKDVVYAKGLSVPGDGVIRGTVLSITTKTTSQKGSEDEELIDTSTTAELWVSDRRDNAGHNIKVDADDCYPTWEAAWFGEASSVDAAGKGE